MEYGNEVSQMKTFNLQLSSVTANLRSILRATVFGIPREDPQHYLHAILSCTLLLIVSGPAISCGGNSSGGTVTPIPPLVSSVALPCDTYSKAGTPCVAAHSTTRALFASYNGALYGVVRASDSTSLDIGLLQPGGYANIVPQDSFCSGTFCTIARIYDQTANHNDLTVEGAGGNGAADVGVPANALPVQAGGVPVYGLSFSGGMGYRNDSTTGVATAGKPEGMYMVTSGTHVNSLCCFDYGNAEINNDDNGNGHMDALNFGTGCFATPCYGGGPWVRADLENGLFQSSLGSNPDSSNTGLTSPFVTAILKNNGQSMFALRAGNAQSGVLTTEYSGAEPTTPGYTPTSQEGAIVLGTGGDNSNGSIGSFFEGVMTSGYPSDATENAVQANIVSVGYDTSTKTAGTLAVGSEISIQLTSSGLTGDYLRHQGNDPTLNIISSQLTSSSAVSDLANATWVVRAGFADPSCFSFQSRDNPGNFIRHFNFILYAQPFDGAQLHAQDATFCAVTGNAGSGYSFQSFNYPTRYIRQYNGAAYLAANGGGVEVWDDPTNFNQDTTFLVVSPLKP
jgi:non-reducing end alpha-L-arabinofuranosidase